MNYCKQYKCTILKKKKKSLKMFTQITYITNLIKLILSSQVTSVHII
jgi:hypothetical protein